jgi:asparagine synthase (glutamine-hydrolysing)
MCGITGFIDFTCQSTENVLEEMTNSLEHRGPDGFGTYYNSSEKSPIIGFGHRRLAILDLSEKGKQPMQWNEWVITFNGEIYNYRAIKEELIDLGHHFTSDSDTEMILHAYDQWGSDCVSKFIGMFAFVLYHQSTHELFIARDRAGVKPLFIYYHNDLFLFASELKAFHQHPHFEKQLNFNAVYAFLQYGSVPTPHCIFNHCFKLKPGHFIATHAQMDSFSTAATCYWNVYDAYNAPKLDLSEAEALQETKSLLHSACEYRMVSDVPVGIFLSGGYDSTAVTALLQQSRTEKLRTYTVSVPDIGLNEAPYAKRTAEMLGTNHTEISCSAQEAIDKIGQLAYFYDEPFADSSAIPTTLVSEIAKQNVSVALSADGGDEVFGGYNRYEMIVKYGQQLDRIPSFIRNGMSQCMNFIPSDKIPLLKNKYNFAQRYEKTKAILANSSTKNIMLSLSQLFTDDQLNRLCKFQSNTLTTYFDSTELIKSTPLSFAMAMDYQTYLLDDILQKVDRASMSVSLESREPFLDHRLIEFTARLPEHFKISNGEKKWLLKQLVHEMIPAKEMNRPKMGFAIPIENWLKKELKAQVEYYLSKETIEQQGLFDYAEVAQLSHAFFNGRKEFGVKIWYLLSFQMWYERWMN